MSYLTPHASHLTRRTPHATNHTPGHTSNHTPGHTSHLTPHSSHLTPYTSQRMQLCTTRSFTTTLLQSSARFRNPQNGFTATLALIIITTSCAFPSRPPLPPSAEDGRPRSALMSTYQRPRSALMSTRMAQGVNSGEETSKLATGLATTSLSTVRSSTHTNHKKQPQFSPRRTHPQTNFTTPSRAR